MGVRLPSVFSTTIVAAGPAQGVETVVATSPALNISLDNQPIFVWVYVQYSLGAGNISCNLRLRRGTTTAGTQLNIAPNDTLGAAATGTRTLFYVDTPGIVAGQQYSLTFQNAGGAGAGVISDVCIMALAL